MSVQAAQEMETAGVFSFSVHTDVVFTPAPWLSRWTPRLALVKLMCASRSRNTWSIRVSKVLRRDDSASLVRLLLGGTLEQFQDIVRRQSIRPNDLVVVAGGTATLLKVCVDWLIAVGISGRDSREDMFSHFLYDGFSPFETVEETGCAITKGGESWEKRLELVFRASRICLWLVESEPCYEISW